MQNKTRNEAAFSRRDFGKLALAGLPLSLVLGEINSRVNGVRIGVQSYSFRTLSLDDAIKAMKDIGIGECELFSGHVEPRPQATSRRSATRAGSAGWSAHSGNA